MSEAIDALHKARRAQEENEKRVAVQLSMLQCPDCQDDPSCHGDCSEAKEIIARA